MNDKALIIGGGIAGPAAAIALRRAGIESVVFEGSRVPRDEAGTFLNLPPNGLNVLGALGLGERVDGLGFLNDRLVFRNDKGRVLAEVRVGGVTLLRGALSRMLREAAVDAGVQFEFGKRLESIEVRDADVVAGFGDGTTARGRVLVGADGIHSRTRQLAFPDASQAAYTGIIHLGGTVRTDLPPSGAVMNMIFGHRGFFGYTVRPPRETYWISNFAQDEEPPREGLDMIEARSWRGRLLELHEKDPPEVRTIIDAIAGNGNMGAYAVYELPSIPRWHRGPVCLIGDAAHSVGPHIGQAPALALEDAFVLAKCLRDLRDDPSQAFAMYERLRRDRVERAVQHSRKSRRRRLPAGVLGRKIRDLVLPAFLRKGAQETEWLYGYKVDWDERVSV